jgi:hypothetical protein
VSRRSPARGQGRTRKTRCAQAPGGCCLRRRREERHRHRTGRNVVRGGQAAAGIEVEHDRQEQTATDRLVQFCEIKSLYNLDQITSELTEYCATWDWAVPALILLVWFLKAPFKTERVLLRGLWAMTLAAISHKKKIKGRRFVA